MHFHRMILILLICILKCFADEENILLNKPAYANDYKEYLKNSNDGDKTTGMWLRSKNVMFIVFDLQKIYNVEKVLISSGHYRGSVPFTIYVGDELKICHLHNQIKHYKICKKDVVQDATEISVDCDGSGVKGRYIAIIKGEFLTEKSIEEFNFYDISAHGKLIGEGKVNSKPDIQSKAIETLSKNDFPLVHKIRKNVPVMSVGTFSMGFLKMNEKCEPIIWDAKWNLTFALACYTDNKQGKALFFGKEWYFWYVMNDKDQVNIRQNFVDWLSPNIKNPKYVNSQDFKTSDDVRKALNDGDILDYYTYVAYPDEVINEIKSLLLNGKISLVYDHNNNNILTESVSNSNEKILEMFNIVADTEFLTFRSGRNYSMSDEDFTDAFVDLKVRLRNLVDNYDYLLSNGPTVLNLYNKMPPKLIENAKVNGIAKDFIKKYDDLIRYICPCKDDPAVDTTDRAIISIFGLFAKGQGLANSNYKLPCIDLFPGDFKSKPKTEEITLELIGEIPYTRLPIGYYLAAGETLKYSIEKSTGIWSMSVGCQSDNLGDNRPEWYRYPNIYLYQVPINKDGSIFSPSGGAVWLENTSPNSTITIKLSNVVPTPFFNIFDETAVSDWDNKQRNNPGLWAQIVGEDMVFCAKSEKVKNFDGDYLKTLMESWDKIVRNMHVYAGLDWRKFRPTQTVLDIMTSAGSGHSGYPISAYDNWFLDTFDKKYLKEKGSWGMCHEIGHNIQNRIWTMSNFNDVTNNIFCLFIFDKNWKLPYYGSTKEASEDLYNEMKNYLDGGAQNYGNLESNTLKLAIYIQMNNNFGFGFYKKVFSYYADHPELKADSDQEKYDLWANVTSSITGQNLVPIFDFWDFPISDKMKKRLSSLPCFIPDDYMMKINQSREEYILKKYPNCHRKSTFNEDFDPSSYIKGHRPQFIKKY